MPLKKVKINISEDIVYPNVIPKTKATIYNKKLPKKVKPSNQITTIVIILFTADCFNTLFLEISLPFLNIQQTYLYIH